MPNEDVTRTNPSSGDDAVRFSDTVLPGERFPPGTVLAGRYRIAARIGGGGMGDLYRADDMTLGTAVALKFLPKHVVGDPARLDRFRGEVRIARQVSHPHICRVFDIASADGQHFITMEYVDGEDLASLLRRIGRLPNDKAIEMARQLCAGLAAAHDADILHRDLKPANIMIDGRGRVRITDFGLAGLSDSFSGGEVRSGTPAYMAPEQLEGKSVSRRSDIYALGLVIYEMFTGRRVFDARTVEDITTAHRSQTPTDPSSIVSEIDPAVSRVILRCLEKDPAKRPNSALNVAMALPGGDPLQAALAAGETPSPELVAAAGERGGLAPGKALAWLLLTIVGLIGFAFAAAPVTLINNVGASKPPVVLEDHARDFVSRLGYVSGVADRARGFDVRAGAISRQFIADQPDRSKTEAGLRRAVRYWYRQHSDGLLPTRPPMQVSLADPPTATPGMTTVELDLSGRLVGFQHVPKRERQDSDSADPAPEQGITMLFALADLDLETFTPVPPRNHPPTFCDDWRAWSGTDPRDPQHGLYVETGLLAGRPIYFSASSDEKSVGPEDDADALQLTVESTAAAAPGSNAATSEAIARDTAAAIDDVLGIVIFGILFAVIGLSCFMAHRNIRLGRGDRRGAFEVALIALIPLMIAWALVGAHGRNASQTVFMLYRMTALATLLAVLTWIGYVAVEPYVRRIWPTVLIGWTRLLSGGWRDPMVGRDMLLGVAVGVAWGWLFLLPWVYCWAIGMPGSPPLFGSPSVQWLTALGPREWLAIVSSNVFNPLLATIVFLLMLFALRAMTRSKPLAITLLLALFLAINLTIHSVRPGGLAMPFNQATVISNLASIALLTLLLLRFGLLSAAVANFTAGLLITFPMTTDTDAWHFSTTVFVLGLVTAMAVFAFRCSTAGRSVLSADWLERA